MIETFVYKKWKEAKDRKEGKEHFSTESSSMDVIANLVSLLFGIAAAYLSWSYNTSHGVGTGMKIFFAFFAFLFGLLYFIFYLLVNYGKKGNKG